MLRLRRRRLLLLLLRWLGLLLLLEWSRLKRCLGLVLDGSLDGLCGLVDNENYF